MASQILLALHAIVEAPRAWYAPRLKPPFFRFEVAHIGGRIRFFIITKKEYQNLIEGQLYAHYPNIEIKEVSDFLSENIRLLASTAKLATHSLNIIKLYTNLKDKTEKESVDPLSSITSVLAKTPKDDIALFHVDFAPLSDDAWRTDDKLQILRSSLPDFIKRILL